MNNLTAFFELLSENIALIQDEDGLDTDLNTVHEVEIIGGVPDAYGKPARDWWIHVNNKQFANVQRNHSGELEACFTAHYSDFDYLFHECLEQHKKRCLFVRLLRRPEMRLLRLALLHLKWEKGVDYHTIHEIEMTTYNDGQCYLLMTDKWQVVCLDTRNPHLTYEDFIALRLHDPEDEACECDACQESRICHIRMKRYYIGLEATA